MKVRLPSSVISFLLIALLFGLAPYVIKVLMAPDEAGRLNVAISRKDVAEVRELLAMPAYTQAVNKRPKKGWFAQSVPLYEASKCQLHTTNGTYEEIVQSLIDAGADVNNNLSSIKVLNSEFGGQTPLHGLMLYHMEVVDPVGVTEEKTQKMLQEKIRVMELLVAKGARWDALDSLGRSPLDLALLHFYFTMEGKMESVKERYQTPRNVSEEKYYTIVNRAIELGATRAWKPQQDSTNLLPTYPSVK